MRFWIEQKRISFKTGVFDISYQVFNVHDHDEERAVSVGH